MIKIYLAAGFPNGDSELNYMILKNNKTWGGLRSIKLVWCNCIKVFP